MAVSSVSANQHYQEILARLRGAGLNPDVASAGLDWLVKALHPAWDHDAGGVPDQSYVNSVHSNITVQRTVSRPPGLAADAEWAFCLWSPPGDMTQVVILTGATGIDFTNALSSTDAGLTGVVVSMLYSAPFENVGVLCEPFAGGALGVDYSPLSASRYGRWRYRYRGLTVYPVAAPLYEQGTIYAAQVSSPVCQGTMRSREAGVPYVTPTPADPDRLAYVEFTTVVPLNEERLVLFDPASVAWPFKNGAYLPTRFTSSDMEFAETPCPAFGTGNSVAVAVFPIATLGTPVAARVRPVTFRDNLLRYSYPPWATDGADQFGGGGIVPSFDTSYDKVTQNVVIGRGIHPLASITIRSYTGKECVPRFDSPEAQFSRSPARFEMKVLDTYFLVAQEMGTVFPSSYNSLGTLLAVIANAARRVMPIIGKAMPIIGRAMLTEGASLPGDLAPLAVRAVSGAVARLRARSRSRSRSVRSVRVVTPRKPAVRKARRARK